jgi:hypothetical protein
MEGNLYWLAGVWGIAMVAIFIAAIRLSYRIEGRSPGLTNTSGLPRNALMFHTVTNLNVARDPETQALRRRMNILLLLNLLGFLVLGAALFWSR